MKLILLEMHNQILKFSFLFQSFFKFSAKLTTYIISELWLTVVLFISHFYEICISSN